MVAFFEDLRDNTRALNTNGLWFGTLQMWNTPMELEQNIRTDTDVLRWALHPCLCSCDAFADLGHICGVCQAKREEANQDSRFVMAVSIKDEDGNIDLGAIAESEF